MVSMCDPFCSCPMASMCHQKIVEEMDHSAKQCTKKPCKIILKIIETYIIVRNSETEIHQKTLKNPRKMSKNTQKSYPNRSENHPKWSQNRSKNHKKRRSPPTGEPRSSEMNLGTITGDPKYPRPTFVAHPPGPLSGTIFGQKS